MKSFLTRLCSGAVLLAVLLVTGFLGGPVLYAFTLLIALVGYMEFLKVFDLQKKIPGKLGILYTVLYFATLYPGILPSYASGAVAVCLIMSLMAVYVFTFPKYKTEEIALAFFGFCYVPFLLSFLFRTRILPVDGTESSLVYWLIFICSWGCDTCAYVVGMLIGKRKLAPVLSPKKSVEGAVGGVVGAALIGFIYGSLFTASSGLISLVCALGALVSQVGDLAASAIKRNHGIKDYGKLIPGHGGVLDRFDSVIFTAPMIYLLAMIFLS